jgi:hypothetical protein
MPVSRKRKNRKSKPRQKAAPVHSSSFLDTHRPLQPSSLLDSIAADRRVHDARRADIAKAAAETLVSQLTPVAPPGDDDLEDELCRRLGAVLWQLSEVPFESAAGPDDVIAALIYAAGMAVRAAPESDRQGPWRVLATVTRISPLPWRDQADDLMAELADPPLLRKPEEPRVTGPALWASDAYGSRWAMVVPFGSDAGSERWYLWDVDACGDQVFTVHSGFYPSAEEALTDWRAAVGGAAAADATLTPVDHGGFAAELLLREDGILYFGGESEQQFIEFHRGRRLAEAALAAVESKRNSGREALTPESAATEFTAWLTARGEAPEDIEEQAGELASSWPSEAPELFGTFSPHRVGLAVPHLRDFYQPDFAEKLVALLPDWITWLAERAGIAPELVERCLPYAAGEPYPGVYHENGRIDYLARVLE